jgi:hypothetical protein
MEQQTPSNKIEELQEQLGNQLKPIKIMFLKAPFQTIKNLYKKGRRNAKNFFNKLTDWLS